MDGCVGHFVVPFNDRLSPGDELRLLSKFFSAPFRFFGLSFYCLFSFCRFVLLSLFVFFLLFRSCFVLFLAHVISSLAYPNLFGTKKLSCCCCWDYM
jgi:hypothetical protein